MQLNENPEIKKLDKLDDGDLMVVLTNKGTPIHFEVVKVLGTEVFLTSENKVFRIFKNTALEDDILVIYSGSKMNRVKFEEIRIKNDQGKVVSILGNPDNENVKDGDYDENEKKIEDDPNKLSGDQKRELVKQIITQERKKIVHQLKNIEVKSLFAIHYGDPVEDEEGINTGEYEHDSTVLFEVFANDGKQGVVASLIQAKGSKSSDFKGKEGHFFHFPMSSQLFEFLDDRICLLVYSRQEGTDKPFRVEFVYHLDTNNPQVGPDDEDETEEENEFGSSKDSSEKPLNRDLLKLVHHKSFADRLFGREGKGIDPLDDIRKRLGLGSRGAKHVKFLINRDIKVDTGKNLYLKKGSEITGKMVNDEKIIVYGRNGRAEIQLYLKNTKEPNVFNVKAVHVDKNGDKEDKGLAKIKMLD
jgi:hypothetical protein